jgi:hypothetical protein
LLAVDLIHRVLKRRRWPIAYQLLRSERNARYKTDAALSRLGWSPRVPLGQALRETVAGA